MNAAKAKIAIKHKMHNNTTALRSDKTTFSQRTFVVIAFMYKNNASTIKSIGTSILLRHNISLLLNEKKKKRLEADGLSFSKPVAVSDWKWALEWFESPSSGATLEMMQLLLCANKSLIRCLGCHCVHSGAFSSPTSSLQRNSHTTPWINVNVPSQESSVLNDASFFFFSFFYTTLWNIHTHKRQLTWLVTCPRIYSEVQISVCSRFFRDWTGSAPSTYNVCSADLKETHSRVISANKKKQPRASEKKPKPTQKRKTIQSVPSLSPSISIISSISVHLETAHWAIWTITAFQALSLS